MAKIPKHKQKDIDIFADLGGLVREVNHKETDVASVSGLKEVSELTETQVAKVVEKVAVRKPQLKDVKEKNITININIPESDYNELVRIYGLIQQKVGARLGISHIIRGWVTRVITAESELLIASENQGKIKTPNRRNKQEMVEADHAMATIQSIAFRRAQKV